MPEAEFRRILVAFDGSEDSVKATSVACAMASKFGAQVTVAHVYSFTYFAGGGTPAMPMPDVQPFEEAARTRAQAVVEKGVALAKGRGVEASGKLIEAPSIVQALVEFASEGGFDLIVAGTKGAGGFKKLILGSVANGLSTHAHCPVLVVR